jgi:eukaryotic-like serine/threonine-protein kinase
MKALEKDRRRRYETANGLATDVQRHLHFEPVVARPPSRLYRFQKLVRRNRVVFAAVAAVLAALVVGLGTSTWLYLKEREARNRAVAAEQQQARLRQEAEVTQRITQAALLVSQEKFGEADKLLDKISFGQPTVEGAAVLRSVGEWHAVEERWAQAADRFALLAKVDPFDGADVATLDCLRLGPALIELRDTNRYERFRQETLARFDAATCLFPDRILKICLLLPAGGTASEALGKFADVTAKSLTQLEAENDAFRTAWRSVALGLWAYRQGSHASAIEWCRRCLNSPENNAPRNATAQLVLAMACEKLGRTDEALAAFAAGREVVEAKFKGHWDRGTPVQGFWFDWDFARILLRESSALVEPPSVSPESAKTMTSLTTSP